MGCTEALGRPPCEEKGLSRVIEGKTLSSDIRGLLFWEDCPGVAKSKARSVLGFDLAKTGLSCLCCKVVFRNDDVRVGIADNWSTETFETGSMLVVELVADDSSCSSNAAS